MKKLSASERNRLKQLNDEAVQKAKEARVAARKLETAKREQTAAQANVKGTFSRRRYKARIILPIEDGCVMVVSDQHYAAGYVSAAHRASLLLAEQLRPYAIVNNGDAIDGASISRWPVGSFTEMHNRPAVKAELDEATARLLEYERLDFVKFRVWNLGNHDARFESRLAEKVPEYADVNGFALKDHFSGWLPAWRTDFCVTPDAVPEMIVKHRFRAGQYSAANNALWAGTNITTGHDHKLFAHPVSDVRGVRWGIDAGTVAPVDSPNFIHYTEDNVQNWQSGFVILHFRGGKFTGPELVYALPDGRVLFRGDVLKV